MVKWLENLFWKFIMGDRWWAWIRFGILIVSVDLIAMTLVDIFAITTLIRMWNDLVFPTIILVVFFTVYMFTVRNVFELDTARSKVVMPWVFFILFLVVMFWGERKLAARFDMSGSYVGYYLIAPLAAVIITVLAAARYVQDIYGLESYSVALLYIASSFFGIAYPKLTVNDGEYQIEPGKVNRMMLIGGPGYLKVNPGSAVILNDVGAKSKVYSSKKIFLSHYGSIVSIIDLNNQRMSVPSVSATTKDGITITIRDIEMRYRIWFPAQTSNESSKNIKTNPYPYDEKSVLDKVYNLNVNENGLTQWSESVKGIVVGQITSYITERQFDEIITPTFQKHEPRQEIFRQIFSSETEKKLNAIGAKLLWCDIGHFEPDQAAREQRVETWGTKWAGNASVVRARGEAQRSAYQELGRAEAQADILMRIIHAFDDIDLSVEKKNQNIRKVVLMRSSQVLEALAATKPLETGKKTSVADSAGDHTGKEET